MHTSILQMACGGISSRSTRTLTIIRVLTCAALGLMSINPSDATLGLIRVDRHSAGELVSGEAVFESWRGIFLRMSKFSQKLRKLGQGLVKASIHTVL